MIDQFDESCVRRLICAILLQAIKDLSSKSIYDQYRARVWIAGDDAKQYAAFVKLDHVWPPSNEIILNESPAPHGAERRMR